MDNTFAIIEKLNQIEKKIDGKFSNRYLSINQVANLTSLSTNVQFMHSHKKRSIKKCSKKLGKLLGFLNQILING